jgi:hypothetical protein
MMNQPVPARGAAVWLESNGYVLRTLGPADITPEVFAWMSRPDMVRNLALQPTEMKIDLFRQIIASADNITSYVIGIYLASDRGALIGFYTLHVDRLHKVGQLMSGMRQNDGSGKDVYWATTDVLLDHFYTARDVDKISIRVLANNYPILFAQRNSPRFTPEMVLKSECLMSDGRRIDLVVLSSWRGDGRDGRPYARPPEKT